MLLTDKEKQELEDAIELMARKKKLMLAAKGTSYHARAKKNLLFAVGLVNKVLKGFNCPDETANSFVETFGMPVGFYCKGCGIAIGYCDCPVNGHLNKRVLNND